MTWLCFRSPSPSGLSVSQAILCSCLGLALLAGRAQGQGTSTQQNPTVTFSSLGTKQVTLTACNAVGCTTVTKT